MKKKTKKKVTKKNTKNTAKKTTKKSASKNKKKNVAKKTKSSKVNQSVKNDNNKPSSNKKGSSSFLFVIIIIIAIIFGCFYYFNNKSTSDIEVTETTMIESTEAVFETEPERELTEEEKTYLSEIDFLKKEKCSIRSVEKRNQTIFIDATGKRFVDECSSDDTIYEAAKKIPDNTFYIIESSDGDYIDILGDEWKSTTGETFDFLMKNQYLYVANTIEDLADILWVDRDVLKETFDKYNKSVDSGDDEFGRTDMPIKLISGPFVATPRSAE